MRLRPALLGAGVAVTAAALALAPAGSAANPTAHTITDKSGDSVLPLASLDLTGATFDTFGHIEGTGADAHYIAEGLQVSVTTAGPVSGLAPGQSVFAEANFGACGYAIFQYTGMANSAPDPVGTINGHSYISIPCGGTDDGSYALTDDVYATVTGNTVTWKVSFGSLPGAMGLGQVADDLYAFTDQQDPTGSFGPGSLGDVAGGASKTAIDFAQGTAGAAGTWTIS